MPASGTGVGSGITPVVGGVGLGSIVGFTSESLNRPLHRLVMTGRGTASCADGIKSIDENSDVGNADDAV